MIHEVNCDRDWFDLLVSRSRTFDIRKDDRRFMVGDYIAFNECGRRLTSDFGLKNGMGPKCMHKWQLMHAPADPAQLTLWGNEDEEDTPAD